MCQFYLDFVGIGAAKAGTTWLAAGLAEHPEVCVSDEKELNYFCTSDVWRKDMRYPERSLQWLQSHFAHCRAGQLRGEFSPNYLLDPTTPQRLRQHHVDLKMLLSLRNPVDALYSYYYELRRRWKVPTTFEAFLQAYPDAPAMYSYARYLERYLEVFPRTAICVVFYDDIRQQPVQVLEEVFGFLAITTDFRPSILQQRVNERSLIRSTLLRDIISDTSRALNASWTTRRIKETLWQHGVSRIVERALAWNRQPAAIPAMNPDTRARLLQHYAEENQNLGALLCRDLSHWNQ
jgi:hypothetical protein